MAVVLSGTLPGYPDNNGISVIENQLLNHPEQGQMIIALVDRKTLTAHSNGRTVITARIREIEAFPEGTSGWKSAYDLLEWQRSQRTGKAPLPLE